VGWQNHLARTGAALVRKTGANGIRLDSLGSYFFPCYNPKHRHASPWDYNRWVCQLLEKVSTAVRRVNPDCLLTTEIGVDFFSQYFHGCLCQATNEAGVAISRDVSTMRVALPEYSVILHQPHGPVSASLAGFPGGNPSWDGDGHFIQLDEKWRAARYPVSDVIRWGDAAHDNPQASRKDVACRRFSAAKMDVVVGARYQYPKGKLEGYYHKNANIDLRKDRVRFEVRLGVSKTPNRVFLVNILDSIAREIAFRRVGDNLVFTVDCNWFMLISLQDPNRCLAWIRQPEPCVAGRHLRLSVSVLGTTGAERATLRAPSLNLPDTRITIPGDVTLRIPDDAPPGRHIITLDGQGLLGAKSFVTVLPL